MIMPLAVPRLTIDALDALPDDGHRYELLGGHLLVTRTLTWQPSRLGKGFTIDLEELFGRV